MLAMFESLSPLGRTIVVLAALVGMYVLSGLLWPFAPCSACRDRGGKRPSPTGAYWGDCRRCGGSGKKIRLISQLLGRK